LNSPELGVETWEFNEYLKPQDPESPPFVIGMDEIQCQVSRGEVTHTKPHLWITTSMDRVCKQPRDVIPSLILIKFPTSMAGYGMGQGTEAQDGVDALSS
jgi:hypothetical protein